MIAKQTSRLTRLVDDMLVLARADAGGYPIVQTQIRLDQLVAECVREFGAPAEDKNITLNTDLHPTTVTGDETLLRRMLWNLIGNGVTYTPSGGSIDVSLTATDGHLLLRVSDTGPGIPAEDRERVRALSAWIRRELPEGPARPRDRPLDRRSTRGDASRRVEQPCRIGVCGFAAGAAPHR